MTEPQSRELDELWTALEPHIEWPAGLALILLFASHPHLVDQLRERAETLLRSEGRTLHSLVPRATEELPNHASELLVPLPEEVRAVWVELWRGSGGADWDGRVNSILQELNQRRTLLERVVRRPTVLVLPTSMRTRVYAIAPDLWTIRSFTADLPSPPAVTPTPASPVSSPQPAFSLPPPSAEEKEWARLLATGEYSRIDARDGLHALAAAMNRGSLTSARHIAQQVIALIIHGDAGDEASAITTDEILRSSQDTSEWTSRPILSAALDELGVVEVRAGNLSAARSLFRRSLDVRELLASTDPHNVQAQRDLSISLNHLSDIEHQAGNLSAARSLLQRSLDLCEKLASTDPHSAQAQRDLFISLSKLGGVDFRAGNLSVARSLFQRARDLCEKLASADPHNAQAQRDLSISLDNLGNLEDRAGDLSAARALFQRSLDLCEMLASADPHSAQAQRDLSISLERLGGIEVQAGNLSAARSLFQRSLDVREMLASADPHSVRAQRDCILAHTWCIELGKQLEDLAMQREHFDAARSLLDTLTARGLVDGHAQTESLRQYLDDTRDRLDSHPRQNPP
jgi:tetratricopeptide (TPR) repeat protein